MKATIHQIEPGSIAEELGLTPGAQVLAVNGKTDLEDLFDYRFETVGNEVVELAVKHLDGSEEVFEIEKDEGDDLGIHFQSPIFTPIKTCNNRCPFCFIDQQPKGLRPSLYVKDDDWRLSYFSNTYITLTNLTDHDRKRIEAIRPGPLYVSVHCTVPEIREQLLQNTKQGGSILKELQWLKSLEIPFHCQVVVCPGINDGEPLTQTLMDLAPLQPEALSVAVIPVGLTQHRDHLPSLNPVEKQTALDVIERVTAFEQAHEEDFGKGFVYLSDEFYYKAGLPLPQYDAYGDFPQLDDGVGTTRMLQEDFYDLADTLPKGLEGPGKNVLLLTGKLGAMVLHPIATRLNEIEGLYVDVLPVESQFWGEAVDVAGLITGQDILKTLQKQDYSQYAFAVVPHIMLKQDTHMFLDGLTVEAVSQQVSLPIKVVEDSYSAAELIACILEDKSAIVGINSR